MFPDYHEYQLRDGTTGRWFYVENFDNKPVSDLTSFLNMISSDLENPVFIAGTDEPSEVRGEKRAENI